MSSQKKFHQVHNDFLLDLLEDELDWRGLLALLFDDEENKALQEAKLTKCATVLADADQKERRLDFLLKVEDKKSELGEWLSLFEFKTDQSPNLFMQILRYLTMLYSMYFLPVLVILIYSGKRKKWSLPSTFMEYLEKTEPRSRKLLRGRGLNFGYELINLHEFTIKELARKAPSIGAGLYILCRIHHLNDEDVKEFYVWSEKLPPHLRDRVREKTILFIVKYDREYTWERLQNLARECLEQGDSEVKRIRFSREGAVAEAREEGIAEGEARGKAEGKAEGEAKGKAEGKAETLRDVALNLLKEGVNEAFICRATKLSRKEVQLLRRGLK